MLDVETPLLNSLLHSNEKQVKAVVKELLGLGKKKVGILGFSFKAGTDDLRESRDGSGFHPVVIQARRMPASEPSAARLP